MISKTTAFKQKTPKISRFKGFYYLTSDRGRIRTPNPQSRNLIFYPVELRGLLNRRNLHKKLFPVQGKMRLYFNLHPSLCLTIPEIVLPSALPANSFDASPITLPIS